jgi:hypothetical protein
VWCGQGQWAQWGCEAGPSSHYLRFSLGRWKLKLSTHNKQSAAELQSRSQERNWAVQWEPIGKSDLGLTSIQGTVLSWEPRTVNHTTSWGCNGHNLMLDSQSVNLRHWQKPGNKLQNSPEDAGNQWQPGQLSQCYKARQTTSWTCCSWNKLSMKGWCSRTCALHQDGFLGFLPNSQHPLSLFSSSSWLTFLGIFRDVCGLLPGLSSNL